MKLTRQEKLEVNKINNYAKSPQFVKDVVKDNYTPLNSDIWDNGIWDGSIDKE